VTTMVWAMVLTLAVAPAVLFSLLAMAIPSGRPVPRWRLRLADRLERVALRLRHRHAMPPDPFLALRVQERLGAVANHVRTLEEDPTVYARAERIIASQLAYDELLAEACSLAGVEVQRHAKGDPAERFREEVELASRGWTW